MPLFSFLIPTRGRPDLVARLFESIVQTTSNLKDLEIILVMDEDDEASQGIRDERVPFKALVVPKGLTMGALNLAAYQASCGRYVMLMNDDVILRTPGWDQAIREAFSRFGDDIALIHVNDLLFREKLCTFPFLSRSACDLIGLCPDTYRRYKIDDHIYETYNLLAHLGHKRIIYLPDVVFEHENHSVQPGPEASAQHVFVSSENKMYVPHGPTIEKDDQDFQERHGERKAQALKLAAHIEEVRAHKLHEARLRVNAKKLEAISAPYAFRKPGFLTVQPASQAFSQDSHRTTIAVVSADIRKEMTQRCLLAIKEHTRNYDLIVLDNAGSRAFNHPAEMNKVLRSVTTDFLVLMDDDVVVEAGWLDGLLKCMDARTAVVAPRHQGKAPFSGAYLMGDDQGTHAHTTDIPDAPREMQCYCSALLLLDVQKVGHILMQEKYRKYFFDLVHGLEVWEAGYRAVLAPEVVVTHFGGGTMGWSTALSDRLLEEDRLNFVTDWVATGRLQQLDQGIWREFPHIRQLVDIPKEIRETCKRIAPLPPMELRAAIEHLTQLTEGFGQFRTLLKRELAANLPDAHSLRVYEATTMAWLLDLIHSVFGDEPTGRHFLRFAQLAMKARAEGHAAAVLCGAGSLAEVSSVAVRLTGIRLLGFTDKNPSRVGTRVEGLPVYSLEEGLRLGVACIIGSQDWATAIAHDLKNTAAAQGLPAPAIYSPADATDPLP